MRNDGRDLRGDSDFGLAPSPRGGGQDRHRQGKSFPVRRTRRSRLLEVDFQFENHALRGLEQNPKTTSRWARLAREGKKVMQFLNAGRYLAVVVDGQVQFYGKRASSR